MKLTNVSQIEEFIAAANKCIGGVKLVSPDGDIFNLKSKFSQYLAIGALLNAHGNELEIFCDEGVDERNFMQFFRDHPEVF